MNTKTKVTLAVLITFFILSVSSLNAGDVNRFCLMYLHDNHQGPAYLVYENAEVYIIGTAWNDQISSLIVPPGCRLQIFKHWKFQGASNTYPTGSYPAVGSEWNDQVSSAKCLCQ